MKFGTKTLYAAIRSELHALPDHGRNVKPDAFHRGVIDDKVTFTILPDTREVPKTTKLYVENPLDKHATTYAATTTPFATSKTFYNFFDAVNTAADAFSQFDLSTAHSNAEEKYSEACKRITQLQALQRNGDTLSQAQKRQLVTYETNKRQAEKKIGEVGRGAQQTYATIMGVHATEFESLCKKHLYTVVEHDVTTWQVVQREVSIHDDTKQPVDVNDSTFDKENHGDVGDFTTLWVAREVTKTVKDQRKPSYPKILEVIDLHLKKFGGYGRREAQAQYLSTNAKFPSNLELISVRTFADLLKMMNEKLPDLSCWRDDPQYANNQAVQNERFVKHSDLQMCRILREAMPIKVQEKLRYKFPTKDLWFDYEDLRKQLTAIVEELITERKANRNSDKNKKPSGEKIPKKAAAKKKFCADCKANGEKEHVYTSHNTNSCHRNKQQRSNQREQGFLNNFKKEEFVNLIKEVSTESVKEALHKSKRDHRNDRGRHREHRHNERGLSRSRSRERDSYDDYESDQSEYSRRRSNSRRRR